MNYFSTEEYFIDRLVDNAALNAEAGVYMETKASAVECIAALEQLNDLYEIAATGELTEPVMIAVAKTRAEFQSFFKLSDADFIGKTPEHCQKIYMGNIFEKVIEALKTAYHFLINTIMKFINYIKELFSTKRRERAMELLKPEEYDPKVMVKDEAVLDNNTIQLPDLEVVLIQAQFAGNVLKQLKYIDFSTDADAGTYYADVITELEKAVAFNPAIKNAITFGEQKDSSHRSRIVFHAAPIVSFNLSDRRIPNGIATIGKVNLESQSLATTIRLSEQMKAASEQQLKALDSKSATPEMVIVANKRIERTMILMALYEDAMTGIKITHDQLDAVSRHIKETVGSIETNKKA